MEGQEQDCKLLKHHSQKRKLNLGLSFLQLTGIHSD